MSVNDYWIAKMQATEAGGEEETETETRSKRGKGTVAKNDDKEEEE